MKTSAFCPNLTLGGEAQGKFARFNFPHFRVGISLKKLLTRVSVHHPANLQQLLYPDWHTAVLDRIL